MFLLAYFEVAVKHIKHYVMEISPLKKLNNCIPTTLSIIVYTIKKKKGENNFDRDRINFSAEENNYNFFALFHWSSGFKLKSFGIVSLVIQPEQRKQIKFSLKYEKKKRLFKVRFSLLSVIFIVVTVCSRRSFETTKISEEGILIA